MEIYRELFKTLAVSATDCRPPLAPVLSLPAGAFFTQNSVTYIMLDSPQKLWYNGIKKHQVKVRA
jgi:hypothetical protein